MPIARKALKPGFSPPSMQHAFFGATSGMARVKQTCKSTPPGVAPGTAGCAIEACGAKEGLCRPRIQECGALNPWWDSLLALTVGSSLMHARHCPMHAFSFCTAGRALKSVVQSILMSDPTEKLDPMSLLTYMSTGRQGAPFLLLTGNIECATLEVAAVATQGALPWALLTCLGEQIEHQQRILCTVKSCVWAPEQGSSPLQATSYGALLCAGFMLAV
eukprot:1158983-Pelagomonas_calceolata.AAC.2